MKKNEGGGKRVLLDMKTQYKAELMVKAWYWYEGRLTDQCNRIEWTLDLCKDGAKYKGDRTACPGHGARSAGWRH